MVTAIDGRPAIETLKKDSFDLVLMDVQMPEMDGFQCTAAIRAKEKATGGHPIIAMTAHALKGDRERCLAAGMDDYVSKPIRTAELFAAIERTMARFTRPAVIPDPPVPVTERATQVPENQSYVFGNRVYLLWSCSSTASDSTSPHCMAIFEPSGENTNRKFLSSLK